MSDTQPSKVTLTNHDLRALRAQAIDAGTLDQWSNIALEWMDKMVLELRRAETESDQARSRRSAADESDAETQRRTSRRELAERILLKLIEIGPAMYQIRREGEWLPAAEGTRLAWAIADAFMKAENQT